MDAWVGLGSTWDLGLFSTIVDLLWVSSLVLTILFLVGCYVLPGVMVRLQSMPWAFQFEKNLDLEFQSVLYATYHTHPFSQGTHLTIVLEQLAWFLVLVSWHPILGGGVLLALCAQTFFQGDRLFSFVMVVIWTALFGVAHLLVSWTGPGASFLVGQLVLLSCGLIRFIGHVVEPVPPMLLNQKDTFVPLKEVHLNGRLFRVVLVNSVLGYISEFASALPFRLFPVQVYWLLQRLGYKSLQLTDWQEAKAHSQAIHREGWNQYKGTAQLFPPKVIEPISP